MDPNAPGAPIDGPEDSPQTKERDMLARILLSGTVSTSLPPNLRECLDRLERGAQTLGCVLNSKQFLVFAVEMWALHMTVLDAIKPLQSRLDANTNEILSLHSKLRLLNEPKTKTPHPVDKVDGQEDGTVEVP